MVFLCHFRSAGGILSRIALRFRIFTNGATGASKAKKGERKNCDRSERPEVVTHDQRVNLGALRTEKAFSFAQGSTFATRMILLTQMNASLVRFRRPLEPMMLLRLSADSPKILPRQICHGELLTQGADHVLKPTSDSRNCCSFGEASYPTSCREGIASCMTPARMRGRR
jgi:hypothetical protein